jgi:DNA mismatch repair protein MLH3
VSELVQNALDADALHVSVGVDPSEWTCWVQDDGYGIPVETLRTIGMKSDAGRYGWLLPSHFTNVECIRRCA